jgi:CubicO group peptidase (beta-lactamase class C family)
VLALLAFSALQVAAQKTPEDHKQIVSALLNSEHVASVSFAQIVGGRTVLEDAFGEQSRRVAVNTATLCKIGSMSKPISAEVILRLASAGKLSLDELMYPCWLDPDVLNDPKARLLTPRLALERQAGFANWRRKTVVPTGP